MRWFRGQWLNSHQGDITELAALRFSHALLKATCVLTISSSCTPLNQAHVAQQNLRCADVAAWLSALIFFDKHNRASQQVAQRLMAAHQRISALTTVQGQSNLDIVKACRDQILRAAQP